MQVFADIDTVERQLPSSQEKEGRGPIVIEAGEQSMYREYAFLVLDKTFRVDDDSMDY